MASNDWMDITRIVPNNGCNNRITPELDAHDYVFYTWRIAKSI